MSTIDRAFIRAYAKEVAPAAPPVEETVAPPAASPYVVFQMPRRADVSYRLEPAAPWGQPAVPAPHAEFPKSRIWQADIYTSPHEEEPEEFIPLVPAASPVAKAEVIAPLLAKPAPSAIDALQEFVQQAKTSSGTAIEHFDATKKEETTPVLAPAAVPAPVVEVKKPVAASNPIEAYTRDEFICLPGMTMPEHGYVPVVAEEDAFGGMVASLVASTLAPAKLQVAPAVAEKPAPAPLPVPIPERVATAESITAKPIAVDEAAAEHDSHNVATERAEVAQEPAPAIAVPVATPPVPVFWEVDRFLISPIAHRLMREFPYFAQAGEKLRQASAAGLKVLAITGLGRNEGRSTLATCLALCAARSGLKVALMDADFVKPELAPQLGLEVSEGWQRVATGHSALAEVAVRSIEDELTLFPLTANGGGLHLGDARVVNVIQQAAREFDVVVLDAGPMTADEVYGKQPFDAAIVVCDRRHHTADEAQLLARQINVCGVEAVGIAENFS